MTHKSSVMVGMILRHNVKLAGDVALARAEFEAFCAGSRAHDILRSDFAASIFKGLPAILRARLLRDARSAGVIGFYGQVPSARVRELTRRIAFAQDLVIAGDGKPFADSPLVQEHAKGVYSAVPVAALCELASHDEVLSHSSAGHVLNRLLAYLLRAENCDDAAIRRIVESKHSTLALSHDLHIYKAKFFPRFVRALLNIYRPADGGIVLDPFSGSGTALLEASALGYRTVGIDVDPISAMISDCKVRPFTEDREQTRAVLRRLLSRLAAADTSQPRPAKSLLPEELRRKVQRRDLKDGTNFLPEIESDLAFLKRIRLKFGREVPEFLDVLLSDAVTKKIRYRYIGVGNGKYTIEIVRQRIADRFREKAESMLALCDVFEWLEATAKVTFAASMARRGNAVTLEGLDRDVKVAACITSPPYLPASSGREHYASSRALSFAITERHSDQVHAQNGFVGATDPKTLNALAASNLPPAAQALLRYLTSDSANCDPQRDAMRFERKAVPTYQYLLDIEQFLRSLRKRVMPDGVCIVVVASQHLFYSHRRQEFQKSGMAVEDPIEYVARGRELYGELAARAGWTLEKEVVVELAKSAVSTARPRSSDEYSESALVLRPAPLRKQVANPRASKTESLVAA